MCLNFGGSNETQLKSYQQNESRHIIMGKNLHPVNSAPSNLKIEVTLISGRILNSSQE